MTYKEMYDHLANDLKKVEYRKEYFLPKAIKEFRKARKFPVWKWYDYKVPSTNNKYVIFFWADNPSCVEHPKSNSNDIACCYLSRNDIAMPIEINDAINKNIDEYGEGAKQGFRVRDGVCFTRSDLEGDFHQDDERDNDRVDAMAIVYTTFMPEYIMTDEQRFAIEKEHWEKWTESFNDFIKEAKDGVLTLKLEP